MRSLVFRMMETVRGSIEKLCCLYLKLLKIRLHLVLCDNLELCNLTNMTHYESQSNIIVHVIVIYSVLAHI